MVTFAVPFSTHSMLFSVKNFNDIVNDSNSDIILFDCCLFVACGVFFGVRTVVMVTVVFHHFSLMMLGLEICCMVVHECRLQYCNM